MDITSSEIGVPTSETDIMRALLSALLFTREVFGNTNSLLRYVDIFLSMMEPYTVEAPKNTLGTAATIVIAATARFMTFCFLSLTLR